MYRCTECQTEYEICPEFCDCGNDTFKEVYEETYDEEYYEPPRPRRRPRPKRVMNEEELEEIEEENRDRVKALVALGVSVFITLAILCCPPYPHKKVEKVKEKVAQADTLPDVSTYWDNTLPAAFRKGDPDAHLPLLNANFGSIGNELRSYLVEVGAEFSTQWNPNTVDGSGECRIQFTINKDGIMENKKMVIRSRNESLDDSVLILLSKITNLDVPPAEYKGERIVLAFKVDAKQGNKVYYPTPKK